MTKRENDSIFIISQYFYGNRTGTLINRDWADHFLRGEISQELYGPASVEDVVRKTVKVPGSDHVVIVYDQTQEDQYLNVDFPEDYEKYGTEYLEHTGKEMTPNVSCEIPEIGLKIHTRCFACRMDESGTLQSLEKNDDELFIHYFPIR